MEVRRTVVVKSGKIGEIRHLFGENAEAWLDNGGMPDGKGDIAPKYTLNEADDGVMATLSRGAYMAIVVYAKPDDVRRGGTYEEALEIMCEKWDNVSGYSDDEIIAAVIREI